MFPYVREYERWTTAEMNAYVQPLMGRYLKRLETLRGWLEARFGTGVANGAHDLDLGGAREVHADHGGGQPLERAHGRREAEQGAHAGVAPLEQHADEVVAEEAGGAGDGGGGHFT